MGVPVIGTVRGWLVIAAAAATLAGPVGAADAADGGLQFLQRLPAHTLHGASDVAYSPDNRHAYVTAGQDDLIAAFDLQGGGLSFINAREDGAGGVDHLRGASAVAVAPDGEHVYATATGDNSVSAFFRSSATGRLYIRDAEVEGVNGVTGLLGARDVAVSPDGRFVFVASVRYYNSGVRSFGSVAVFRRDRVTGSLTFVESETDGSGGITSLGAASGVAASEDGSFLYVAARADHAVTTFSVNQTSGGLTFVDERRQGVGGIGGLENVEHLAISEGGQHLYAVGHHMLAVFRTEADGSLTVVESKTGGDGAGEIESLWNVDGIAVSPDGSSFYTVAGVTGDLAVYARNATTGALTFLDSERNSEPSPDAHGDPTAITVAPDGQSALVTGDEDDIVARFSRSPGLGSLSLVVREPEDILEEAQDVEMSPDGRHLYAVTDDDSQHMVVTVARDPATGRISHVEEIPLDRDAYGYPPGILVSADGRNVYATAESEVVAFSRNPVSGRLARIDTANVSLTAKEKGFDLSPDGRHIYVPRHSESSGPSVIDRDPDTGLLSEPRAALAVPQEVNEIVVSPDGDHVYGGEWDADRLTAFTRDESTGALTALETFMAPGDGSMGFERPNDLALPPDGESLYVSGDLGSTAIFDRNPATGRLAFLESEEGDTTNPCGFMYGAGMAFSPDGGHAYFSGQCGYRAHALERNTATGGLSVIDSLTEEPWLDGLSGASRWVVAPDGRHVYAVDQGDGAIAAFVRVGFGPPAPPTEPDPDPGTTTPTTPTTGTTAPPSPTSPTPSGGGGATGKSKGKTRKCRKRAKPSDVARSSARKCKPRKRRGR